MGPWQLLVSGKNIYRSRITINIARSLTIHAQTSSKQVKRNLSNTSRICSITSGSLDLKQVLNYQLIYILSMYYWLAVCGFSPHLDSVRGFEPFLNSVCGFLPFQNSACSFWPFSTAICGFPCGNIRCDILGLTQLHQKHHSKKSPNKSPCPSPPYIYSSI